MRVGTETWTRPTCRGGQPYFKLAMEDGFGAHSDPSRGPPVGTLSALSGHNSDRRPKKAMRLVDA